MSEPVTPPGGPAARLGLRRAFAWTTAGYAVYTLAQWLVLVVAARLTDLATVGRLGLALAICAPVAMLTNLGLRVGQATDARRAFDFGSYFALRLLGGATTLVVVGFLASWFWRQGHAATATMVLLVGACKTIESQSDVFYGLFQQRERMDLMARSLMLRGVLGLAALTGLTYATGRIEAGLAGQAAAWAFALAVHDLPSAARLAGGARAVRPDWSPAPLAELFRVSLPLGLAAGAISLRQSTPRYVTQLILGLEAVGLYTAAHYLLNAVTLFVNALGHTASARLARLYAAGAAGAFRRLLVRLAAFGLLVGLGLLVLALAFGEPVLRLFYGDAYQAARIVLVALMAAAGARFAASLLQFGIMASRRFWEHLVLQSGLLVLAVVACWLLTDAYGLAGAGWAVFVVALAHFATVAAADLRLAAGLEARARA